MENNLPNYSIIWRRLDCPGHEATLLSFYTSNWHLSGTAVFVQNKQPCRLDYQIICDAEWKTLSARVYGWIGNKTTDTRLEVISGQRWQLNQVDCPVVTGCMDLDLEFSPSTNLFPIRRLALEIGQEMKVRAAWLRFPSFALEPLQQIYRRIDARTYHYEIAGGGFSTELRVNAIGFVNTYPNVWRAEETI
ncbi:MAG TPA: putative glycolipid-binding domain-containing protein [Acidobacteriota bacterium]|nr:putative glycolipid-binding domain-containing protein [Acidobacteriota bacterium]